LSLTYPVLSQDSINLEKVKKKMKILLMTHLDFLYASPETETWLRAFGASLSRRSHRVEHFDPVKHKVRDFDIVHLFSSENPETWKVLKDLGVKVFITPSFQKAPQLSKIRQCMNFVSRVGRGIFQRKWPPIDEDYFRNSADEYWVTSPGWKRVLEVNGCIESSKIKQFPFELTNPDQAVSVIEPAYQRICLSTLALPGKIKENE
jgi:hypothetical protein